MSSANPLLAALPPATDFLSYLTIIEYNLSAELLPTLHDVLQDATLTENIGWDLVHLLLPLLPASENCLQDVARLGNPREVILKVTEALRADTSDDNHDDSSTDEQLTSRIENDESATTIHTASAKSPLPLHVLRYQVLTSMLSTLHSRIKTRHPSRFLSGSLQAVLLSITRSTSHPEHYLLGSVELAENLSKICRTQLKPQLPPRASSAASVRNCPAPDPEAEQGRDLAVTADAELQARLLQSFITYALEQYMLHLQSDDDFPGLSWSSRLHEKHHPERTVKGKKSVQESYETDPAMNSRLLCLQKVLRLRSALDITNEELLRTITTREQLLAEHDNDEDEPPKNAGEIPLSRNGALMLLAARAVDGARGDGPILHIWPGHADILHNLSAEAERTIDSGPEPVLDAVLALAANAVDQNCIGEPTDATDFNKYLQAMSLIASNCPSPSLRFQAYYLTTTILRSNPSDLERLAFIHDTLEHCPFDNLKVAAISWAKGEIIEANPPRAGPNPGEQSVFSTPIALDTLGPFLFPDLTQELASRDVTEMWETFDLQSPFYLASLNFYFLLLSAKHLLKPLALPSFHTNNEIAGSFMQPLRDAVAKLRNEAGKDSALTALWKDEQMRNEKLGQLQLIEYSLDKVTRAIASLNEVA